MYRRIEIQKIAFPLLSLQYLRSRRQAAALGASIPRLNRSVFFVAGIYVGLVAVRNIKFAGKVNAINSIEGQSR